MQMLPSLGLAPSEIYPATMKANGPSPVNSKHSVKQQFVHLDGELITDHSLL